MTDGTAPEGGRAGSGRGRADPEEALDLQRLARDWIDLWQSELAAIAVDREAQETTIALLGLWAGAAAAMLNAMPRPRPPDDGAPRRTRPEPAAGPPPAAAAPDPRDAEIERLARHVAELEARLAGLERGRPRQPAREPRKRRR